jgi:hypothetical protein
MQECAHSAASSLNTVHIISSYGVASVEPKCSGELLGTVRPGAGLDEPCCEEDCAKGSGDEPALGQPS